MDDAADVSSQNCPGRQLLDGCVSTRNRKGSSPVGPPDAGCPTCDSEVEYVADRVEVSVTPNRSSVKTVAFTTTPRATPARTCAGV
jgi:hypothetical protein